MTDFEIELAGRLHEANLRVVHAAEAVEQERGRPFMLLRPRLFPEGNQWCALYGENIQEGVAGFGDTPASAAVQFDIEWLNARCAEGKPCTSCFGDKTISMSDGSKRLCDYCRGTGVEPAEGKTTEQSK
jgi:hypothetical protein